MYVVARRLVGPTGRDVGWSVGGVLLVLVSVRLCANRLQ